MSSSRLTNFFVSSSLRWQVSTTNGLRPSLTQAGNRCRGFHQSLVSAAATKVKRKQSLSTSAASEEEIAKGLEQLAALSHLTGADVWNQRVQTLDLVIPSWRSQRPNASILDHIKAMRSTQKNWVLNVVNMFRTAKENAFPDVKVKSSLSFQLFKAQSSPWLAGLRRRAVDTYKNLNEAVAANDDKAVRKYAIAGYQDMILNRLRAQNRDCTYVWKFHGENVPCKVLSLRSYPAHLGREDPQFGNRLLIQALVKFDTSQSLQVYNKTGKIVAGDGKPKRVVEYLVFQKKGWIDGPWLIREQLYEGLEDKFVAP